MIANLFILSMCLVFGKPTLLPYCGIILIYRGQCSWIVKIFLVHGDVNTWATGFIAFQFKINTLLVKCSWGCKFVGNDYP